MRLGCPVPQNLSATGDINFNSGHLCSMGDPPDISRLVRIAEATSDQASNADADARSTETCLETLSQLEQASVTVEVRLATVAFLQL